MNNLIKLEGLSKIEIIKYLYVQLKHIYPKKIQFYTKIFYLPYELINYIFDYLISNQICSIGKIVYLHLYNKNLIINKFYIEYIDYFNKEWNSFVNARLKQKYIKMYYDYLSFSNNKYNFISYMYKKTNKQQRKKIKDILQTCDCCPIHHRNKNKYLNNNQCFYIEDDDYYYDDNVNYLGCTCPCAKIIEIIEYIEEDLYIMKLEKEYNDYYESKKSNKNNNYLKISNLLSNKSCDNLSIDELNENDWIYYDSIEYNKVQ